MLANIYSLMGKTTAERALKSINNAEQMKKVWAKIGHANKKGDGFNFITSSSDHVARCRC
eukprot:10525567-Ditylum_brightwellii.AAC.1